MRPIHGLVALAVLVVLLIGALLVWTGGDSQSPEPTEVEQRPVTRTDNSRPEVDLVDAPDPGGDRTAQAYRSGEAPGRTGNPAGEGRAQRVSGRVVDVSGKPISGATVYAAAGGGIDDMALDELDPNEVPWFQRTESVTDSDGRFALDPRVHARVRLAVRAAGFAPLDLERTISETKPDVGDLVVQQGAILEGRVIDNLGRPVEGAELRRRRASTGPMAMFAGRGGAIAAKSDSNGDFRIDTLAVGAWSLRVTSEIAPDKDETGETARAGEVVRGLVIQLEEGFEITGRVTGAPVAELAALRVVAMPSRGDFGGEMPLSFISHRSAAIAADGSFVVRGCKKDSKHRLSVRLADSPMGGLLRSPLRSASVDAIAGESGVQIAYRAETALTFQVVDEVTGAPLTSLSVSAGARFMAPLVDEKNVGITEFPDGRVRYGGLRLGAGGPFARGGGASGNTVNVRVESAGYAPFERKDVQVTEGAENDLGVFRMGRTSIVEVRVTSASSGLPIAGANVALQKIGNTNSGERTFTIRAGGDDALEFGGGGSHRGRTDADGIARVSSMPGSSARIVVTHKDYARLSSEPIDLPVGTDVERAFVLSGGGTIVVRVVDATGEAVSNEPLEHRAPGTEDLPIFFGQNGPLATDAEGRTTLRNQAPGVHGFRLQGSGGPRMFGGGGGGMRMSMSRTVSGGPGPAEAPYTEVTVTEGGRHEIVLTAPERARALGRVREGGRPLAGATVRLVPKDGGTTPFFDDGDKADTDGAGEYLLENVSVGDYVLSVTHPTRVLAHEIELRVGSGETRENVDLPLSIVEGRVTDEEGRPAQGVRIAAERRSGSSGTGRQFVFAMDSGDGPVSFGGGGGAQVTTDSDGRYKLRGVPADTDLIVIASGQGVQRTASDSVRVPVDGTRSGVDLVVKKGAALEVTCRRPDGTPATPCEVRAELQAEDDSDTKFEITRGDGKARFQGLKPGRWRISARDLASGPGDRDRAPVEQTVEIEVGKPNQLTLELRGG